MRKDIVYEQPDGDKFCMFNGVGDWNYEEEMIGGRTTIRLGIHGPRCEYV